MATLEYKPMRHGTFQQILEQIPRWVKCPAVYKRPTDKEMRRMKIHALLCLECRKTLEHDAAKNEILVGILQEIRDEELLKKDALENLLKPGEADDLWSKQLLFEPMLFRDDEESPPNSEPVCNGPKKRFPITDRTHLTGDRCEDPRHAHFEQMLNVDGDD